MRNKAAKQPGALHSIHSTAHRFRPLGTYGLKRAGAASDKLAEQKYQIMPPVSSMLGSLLKDPTGGPDVPTSALDGKVVALYFSASW